MLLCTANASRCVVKIHICVDAFHLELDAICSILCYYAASSGISLPTLRDTISGRICIGQDIQEEDFRLRFLDH